MIFKSMGNGGASPLLSTLGLVLFALSFLGLVACLIQGGLGRPVPRVWLGVTGGLLLLAFALLSPFLFALLWTNETVK